MKHEMNSENLDLEFNGSVSNSSLKTQEGKINLIQGTYMPEEAGDILFSLLKSKINYLNIQIWSMRERYGIDDEELIKRVQELRNSHVEVAALVRSAKEQNKKLNINANIQIEFI